MALVDVYIVMTDQMLSFPDLGAERLAPWTLDRGVIAACPLLNYILDTLAYFPVENSSIDEGFNYSL
jgi:hypothetical protein